MLTGHIQVMLLSVLASAAALIRETLGLAASCHWRVDGSGFRRDAYTPPDVRRALSSLENARPEMGGRHETGLSPTWTPVAQWHRSQQFHPTARNRSLLIQRNRSASVSKNRSVSKDRAASTPT